VHPSRVILVSNWLIRLTSLVGLHIEIPCYCSVLILPGFRNIRMPSTDGQVQCFVLRKVPVRCNYGLQNSSWPHWCCLVPIIARVADGLVCIQRIVYLYREWGDRQAQLSTHHPLFLIAQAVNVPRCRSLRPGSSLRKFKAAIYHWTALVAVVPVWPTGRLLTKLFLLSL
jgi:hypothetical protein